MRKHRRYITVVNNEIDYDKLAEAIVRANNSTKTEIDETQEKLEFKKLISAFGSIIINKHQSNGTTTSSIFGLLISFVFNALALLSLVVLVCGIIASVMVIAGFVWTWKLALANIMTILLIAIALIIIALFAFLFRAAANEMDREKDRNYIVNVFSAIVSFAALMIALVAFLKGVA